MTCVYCHNNKSRLVTIWNPQFIEMNCTELLGCQLPGDVNDVFRRWKQESRERNKYLRVAVPCHCTGRGDSYNPKLHCLAGNVRDLVAFVADVSRYESDPDNFEWRGAE